MFLAACPHFLLGPSGGCNLCLASWYPEGIYFSGHLRLVRKHQNADSLVGVLCLGENPGFRSENTEGLLDTLEMERK